MVAKFNTASHHPVHLWMALIRLPRVGSDVLLTWNDPEGRVREPAFVELLESFRLADWSLFA